MRRAICASSALRRGSGMRGPMGLPELFATEVVPRRSVLRPTAPPTIVRSAAGLTLDFSEAIAGVSAAGAFLSADHAEPGGKRPARINPAHERNRAPIFR